MKDLIVQSANPKALDLCLNQIGAVVMQESDGSYPMVEGGFRVRMLNGNWQFLKSMIESQGYGKVIGEISEE